MNIGKTYAHVWRGDVMSCQGDTELHAKLLMRRLRSFRSFSSVICTRDFEFFNFWDLLRAQESIKTQRKRKTQKSIKALLYQAVICSCSVHSLLPLHPSGQNKISSCRIKQFIENVFWFVNYFSSFWCRCDVQVLSRGCHCHTITSCLNVLCCDGFCSRWWHFNGAHTLNAFCLLLI